MVIYLLASSSKLADEKTLPFSVPHQFSFSLLFFSFFFPSGLLLPFHAAALPIPGSVHPLSCSLHLISHFPIFSLSLAFPFSSLALPLLLSIHVLLSLPPFLLIPSSHISPLHPPLCPWARLAGMETDSLGSQVALQTIPWAYGKFRMGNSGLTARCRDHPCPCLAALPCPDAMWQNFG